VSSARELPWLSSSSGNLILNLPFRKSRKHHPSTQKLAGSSAHEEASSAPYNNCAIPYVSTKHTLLGDLPFYCFALQRLFLSLKRLLFLLAFWAWAHFYENRLTLFHMKARAGYEDLQGYNSAGVQASFHDKASICILPPLYRYQQQISNNHRLLTLSSQLCRLASTRNSRPCKTIWMHL
jgi:hypothetical protein